MCSCQLITLHQSRNIFEKKERINYIQSTIIKVAQNVLRGNQIMTAQKISRCLPFFQTEDPIVINPFLKRIIVPRTNKKAENC